MTERNYEDLVTHTKKDDLLNDAESAFKDYMELTEPIDDLKMYTNPTPYFMRALKDAYISGWNQHKYVSGKMYTIEEVKEIVN